MKKAFLVFLLGVTLSVMSAGVSFAEFVYITKNGKKYHHAESRFIKGKDNVEKITLEEAEERGLKPSRAYLNFKDSQDDNSSNKKTSSSTPDSE